MSEITSETGVTAPSPKSETSIIQITHDSRHDVYVAEIRKCIVLAVVA